MARRRIALEGAQVEVAPAFGNWDGFYEVVGVKTPDGRGCWCMAYRDSRVPADARGDHMRQECGHEPGPGVLAYVDGAPAGWCSVAPRSSYRRLMHSRTIPFVDDAGAWSVVCFVVKPPYRGQGLMHTLLDGAVAHAVGHGASVVEGYPIDVDDAPEGTRVDVVSGYVGTTRLFEASGFERVVKTGAHSGARERWLMRRILP